MSGLGLSDLPATLRERVIASCREREPSATAILVHGSYARGCARPDSDLDLGIFMTDPPTAHYRTWFEERPGTTPLHVSARSDLSVEAWEEEDDEAEPEEWAFGLPVELVHVWLWVGDESIPERLGDAPVLHKPGAKPEVEDMVTALVKARRAATGGDEPGLRMEAQQAGSFAARCVAALNEPSPVRDPRSALDALLALPIRPEGWAGDVTTCLGLTTATAVDVCAAADRLVLGVLALLRDTGPDVDEQPGISECLRDGTFERILRR